MDTQKINEILTDCLFTEEELVDGKPVGDFIEVLAITNGFGLNPVKVAAHKEEIKSLLSELDDAFMADKGGGMSFLNMCVDRHGQQWGEHVNCEQLMVLGIASGYMKYLIPRDMWAILPGGMPYLEVNLGA